MADMFGALAPMPRNPARMPQAVEDFAYGALLEPAWDVAKGVGALATGQGMVPEVGAGIMGAMGIMAPGARMAPTFGRMLAAEKGIGSAAAAFNPAEHIQRLSTALHGEPGAFPAAFEQLKALPPDQLKAIAKEFVGVGASSGKDALSKIWGRHQNLENYRMKQQFVAGRSAG